jgi:hypothetical protein
MRFAAAQLMAYVEDGLWLRLAQASNAAAARIAAGTLGLPGLRLIAPVEANELFLETSSEVMDALEQGGFQFYRRSPTLGRFVCRFDLTDAEAGALVAALAAIARRPGQRSRRRPLFRHQVFELHTTPGTQAGASPFDPCKESRIVFQPVIEPVVLRTEADQHTGGLAVAGNDDLLILGLAQKAREIVFHLGQRNLFHARSPNCASHDSLSDLATIARISTVAPETS